MSFSTLALIAAAGLLGPLLASPRRMRIPILIGELAAGIALGNTGAQALHPDDATFSFLANVGFALVMFVAGSRVPLRTPGLRSSVARGAARAIAVGAIAVPLGWLTSHAFDTGHAAVYAVLIASSSAALILPLLDSVGAAGADTLDLLAQVAIADSACIVALPLAIEPSRAGRAAVGAVLVTAAATAAFLALRKAERSGLRKRVHDVSEERKFAVELRVSLLVLFALAALATATHVSIMLAGFSLGLAVTAVGEPRRLAHQMFALTEGFFGPLFFIWIGATLDLRTLSGHPKYVVLGLALGAAAVGAHAVMSVTRQPARHAVLASAQLGVPIAAVAIGAPGHLLHPGEPAGILLGALLTVVAATVATVSGRWSTAPSGRPSACSSSRNR